MNRKFIYIGCTVFAMSLFHAGGIQAQEENKDSLVNVSEPSLKMFLEACVKDNKGIAYRYVGDTSGENISYLFTVAELKELLSK